jgi:hypothetical protein
VGLIRFRGRPAKDGYGVLETRSSAEAKPRAQLEFKRRVRVSYARDCSLSGADMKGHHGQRGSDSVIQSVARGVPFERPRGAADARAEEVGTLTAEALKTLDALSPSAKVSRRKRSKKAFSGSYTKDRNTATLVTDLGKGFRSVEFVRAPLPAPPTPRADDLRTSTYARRSAAPPAATRSAPPSPRDSPMAAKPTAAARSGSRNVMAPMPTPLDSGEPLGRVRCFTCQRVMKEENWERHRVRIHGFTAGVYSSAGTKPPPRSPERRSEGERRRGKEGVTPFHFPFPACSCERRKHGRRT